MSLPIRVACVDDNEDLVDVLRRTIDSTPGMTCVACLCSADELESEVGRSNADVVLLDATMPGRNPFDAMRDLTASTPRVKVIVFSGYDDDELVERALDCGAYSCLSKHGESGQIIREIQRAYGHD